MLQAKHTLLVPYTCVTSTDSRWETGEWPVVVQIHRSHDVLNTSDECLSGAVTPVIGTWLKDRMCCRILEVLGLNPHSNDALPD